MHEAGGRIFIQLWHVGRISHVSLQPGGGAPVAPSAIRAKTKTFVADGFVDVSEPRALDLSEIPGIVADYARAAELAKDAGFDGVEIHAANGYLLDQFQKDGSNQRTDAYGGSIENRCRLTLEVVDAIAKILPPSRIGIRLSPVSPANDVSDSNPQALVRLSGPPARRAQARLYSCHRRRDRRRARHRAVRLCGVAQGFQRRLYRQQFL